MADRSKMKKLMSVKGACVMWNHSFPK